MNGGILTTGSIMFHQFGSIGERQHVVPLDVIRYQICTESIICTALFEIDKSVIIVIYSI